MIRRLSLAVALLVLCLFAAPRPAAAYDIFGGVNCSANGNSSSASNSAVCQGQPATDPTTGKAADPIGGANGLLAKITNIVAYAGGAAAIILVIVSALRFVTSGSDVSTSSRTDTDVENARRSLSSALIGLAIIVLARTLILFVLKKV